MIRQAPLRVLFTGYAPVHFICFRPLYRALHAMPEVEVYFSGGLRSKTATGLEYDEAALYEPFGVPADRVLTVDEIQHHDFDVLFSANSKLIMPRSVERKIQIFHGISFRNRSIRAKNMGCDHYFLVGPYQQRRFVDAGLLEPDDPRTVHVGFMKTDCLLDGTLDRGELLARFGFDGSRPVVLYAPTGLAHNSLETMGEEVIRHLKISDQYDLIVKLHDHPKKKIDWTTRLSRFEDEHCRVARDVDVVPLLYLADMLISDASSVSNEYTLLDRPMVFLDVPRLIEQAASIPDSMIDVDHGRWGGLTVTQPQNVPEALALLRETPTLLSEVRQAVARRLFYNPGRAAPSALDWIRNNLLPARVGTAEVLRHQSPVEKAES